MIGSGRRGRGGTKQRTNKHTKGNENQNSDPPPPPPPPPPPEQNDKINHFKLSFNLEVLEAKQISVKTVIQDTCKSISKKIRCKARFSPTTKIQLPPQPIKNITTDFPPTGAKLQDFFQVHKANNGQHVVIHMSSTMLGTTKSALHESMVNTLKQNNVWSNSYEIAAKRKYDVDFVQNGNSDYTHHQGTAEKLLAVIIKLASTDSTAVALFSKIKGKNFIQRTSKRIYGTKVIGEGISIQTTNNNYGLVVRLFEMLPPNSISQFYIVRSKMMKKAMNPNSYNKLILRHQEEVNKQGNIVLMNVGVDLFETQVNFAKHTPN